MNNLLSITADCKQTATMSDLIFAHARHLRAAGQSTNTVDSRIRVLKHLHADLPFGLLYASTEELEDWLQSDPSWSAWTLSTYAMHIRGFYRWANRRYLVADPSADMARPRTPDCIPHPVTDQELATALRYSPEPWYTAIMLAAFAGLRASELAGVRREHVTEHSIRIVRAKGGNPASVDTHPLLWKLAEPRRPGPLAARADGTAITGKWIATKGRPHFDRIGLPAVTMHRFRHWFGTTLLDGGADLRTVQEAMRHRSIISTQGYTLVSGGQRRLAIRSLPAPTEHPEES